MYGARPTVEPGSSQTLDRCSTIISTGRCGSTLLSRLISQEPETLSVFESLGYLREHLHAEPDRKLTGAEYWALLSTPNQDAQHLLKAGIVPEQWAYPETGRWGRDKVAVPPILRITLPRVSADPDRLFDLLAEKVPQFPPQPACHHHKMWLDLLAVYAGRRRWVERTGGSSGSARWWLPACPDAKVVHLTRNATDTALSMSRHPSYQWIAIRMTFLERYGADPYDSQLARQLPAGADMPDEMRRLTPEQLSAQTLKDLDIDMDVYEGICAFMNHAADQALAGISAQRLYRIRYEDLRADPVGELTMLGEFLEFADPSRWANRVAAQVRVTPRAHSAQRS